jgi:hypothetical protein
VNKRPSGPPNVEGGGFRYYFSELDGCKVVECVCPASVDPSEHAVAMTCYYTAWADDDSQPTVTLTDVTELSGLDKTERMILISLMKRNHTRPGYLGSAWFYGNNEEMVETIREAFSHAGRDVSAIFKTREEAIEHLRHVVASSRASHE